MRCYSAWPPALQVFLQCDNGVIRGNAQPVRGATARDAAGPGRFFVRTLI
jgi:hypothetical protein